MESNHNLESLREISKSQVEALLRFDSPPETPNELLNPIILSGNSIQKGCKTSKTEIDVNPNNSIIYNREPFVSQLDSEIDFSIFHHDSSNLQWRLSASHTQPNKNEDSIIVSTCADQTTLEPIEISNLSMGDNKRHTEVKYYLECGKSKENATDNLCNASEKHRNSEPLKVNKSSHAMLEKGICNDFEEIDNIFQNINFDNISNLEEFHLNKMYNPRRIQRQLKHFQCQTQLELKMSSTNLNEHITASCPALIRKHNPVVCRSPQLKELYSNISQSSFPKNESIINSDYVELNNIYLPDISMRNDDQENNMSFSLDTNLDNNMVEIDDIFETLDFGHLSNHPHSIQEQSQNQTPSNQNHLTNLKALEEHSIPFTVRQLHEIVKTEYSDFAFIYALSSQLCQDRVPMECFVTLKMSLLLSLVSIGNNVDRHPIPIVAMTNDTYMTDYLMKNIGQLGSRFLGPVDCVKSFSSNNWMEADPILLARGGVYYAGDWTRLKLRRTETLFKNIECLSVALEKSTLSFPLETAVWTHWRSFKCGAREQQMFNKFLKIFGIPIFVTEDNHEGLVDYTLEQASVRIFESTVDHLSINEDDMRSFLVYVSQTNLDLSPEAALLLKDYFVASRSSRQDCLTKQSYVILKQFAESFAKLSMHKEVLSDDAVAAIILCEHFIQNVFSSNDNSPPHFGNFTFVGEVDKYFMQFKEWLNSYLEKCAKE